MFETSAHSRNNRVYTTSFLHGVGKVKVLTKLELDFESLELLNGLGDSESVSDQLEKSVMEFIQLLCYSGKKA